MNTDSYAPYPEYKNIGVEWVGDIPSHWETTPNKYLFRLKKNLVGKRSNEYTLLSLTLGGIIARDMENPEGKFPAEFDTYQEVFAGDFVFCHFDVEETPRTIGLSPIDGMITGAYTVYETIEGVDLGFLEYFYLNADKDKKLKGMYRGLRNTIPKESFGAFQTPIPPLPEQKAIATFLDQKTAKIDQAIKIKEQQIALLKERKQITIQQAVTRGLNPDAPMKDSGIDWIGEIPAHWESIKLKHLFYEVNNRTDTGEEVLLSLRMEIGLVPHDEVSDKAISDQELVGYKIVEPGQVVMNRMRASIGIFGVATRVGLVSPDYAVFDVAPSASNEYFLIFFKTSLLGTQFRLSSKGLGTGSSGFMRLYTDNFGDIKVPLCDISEQDQIVQFIQRKTETIDDGISVIQSQIDTYKEYKTTLINAAVTGKIKVA